MAGKVRARIEAEFTASMLGPMVLLGVNPYALRPTVTACEEAAPLASLVAKMSFLGEMILHVDFPPLEVLRRLTVWLATASSSAQIASSTNAIFVPSAKAISHPAIRSPTVVTLPYRSTILP